MEPADGPDTGALAREIRSWLTRHDMTQAQLATSIGISRTALSDKLAGRTQFTLAELEATARTFGVTVSALLYCVEPKGATA